MLDDAALLEEWVVHRREEAFAQLVEQYQKLVFGAAFRRTGDYESARDVAQQVFALLAAKAPMLLPRRNVAGWLYYVASYLGGRALRSELRRTRAQENAATPADCGIGRDSRLWETVESAISLVPTALAAIVGFG